MAVRAWLPYSGNRVQLRVRSDNVGALTVVIKMCPHTPSQAIIARELALAFLGFTFLLTSYHTLGVAHVIADKLPRVNDPAKPEAKEVFARPVLADASRKVIPDRTPGFYRTLNMYEPAEQSGSG